MTTFNKDCLRKTANIAQMNNKFKFDSSLFKAEEFRASLDKNSPKLVALLDKIKKLDDHDQQKWGKKFKHFCFSEIKSQGAGARAIAAGLLADGFQLAYDKKLHLLPDNDLRKNSGNNFVVMTGPPVYKQSFGVKIKKDILTKFNSRPDNVHGDLVRIIVLDSSFKEGIDLFDIKYVHIFEPQVSRADLRQSIGRATRLCGTSGLEFHPNRGWPLYVYLYDVQLTSEMVEKYGKDTLFNLYMKWSGIDIKKLEFVSELEKLSIFGSVDYELTKNVHEFKLASGDTADLHSQLGGNTKNLEVICSGNCGKGRPTKQVPVGLALFCAVFFSQNRIMPRLKKTTPVRPFFCELLRKDKKFCDGIREAYHDPISYVKYNQKQLYSAIQQKRHLALRSSTRNSFFRFLWNIIEKPQNMRWIPQQKNNEVNNSPPVSAKSIHNNNNASVRKNNVSSVKSFNDSLHQNNINNNLQNDNINASPTNSFNNENSPKSAHTKIPEDIGFSKHPNAPAKLMSFDELREFVRENYLQYSWPHVKLENLCSISDLPKSAKNEKELEQAILLLPWKNGDKANPTPIGTSVKNLKPNTPIETVINNVKANTPVETTISNVKNNTPVITNINSVKSNTPVETSANNVKPNTPVETFANNVKPNVVLKTVANNVKPNVLTSNTFNIKPSTPIETAAQNIKPNTPVETFVNNVKPNTPVETTANNVKPNVLARPWKNNVKQDTPVITVANNVKLNTPVSTIANDVKSNTPVEIVTNSPEKIKLGGANPSIVTFSPTQEFVRHFITPQSAYKGILNFHSVGSGKTCCAIATATTSFAPQGWTILWVTRASLKSDIFKNQFDSICNLQIRDKIKSGYNMPNRLEEKMRLLSKEWSIRPMSYKQFTNMIDKKNSFYESLVKKNGEEDPLKKTLLIIDEAHKLYGGSDLLSNEKPDMKKFKSSLMHSYISSGHESVKLMLMTGTPITNDAMELVKLVNLMKPPNDQFPENFDEFSNSYLDETGKFTEQGSKRYLDEIAGYISYLSREGDARQFAQPIILPINVEISLASTSRAEIDDLKNKLSNRRLDSKQELRDLSYKIKDMRAAFNQNKRDAKEKCRGLPKNEKSNCLANAAGEIDIINEKISELPQQKRQKEQEIKTELKNLRNDVSSKRRELKTDISQQAALEDKCQKLSKSKLSKKLTPNDTTNNNNSAVKMKSIVVKPKTPKVILKNSTKTQKVLLKKIPKKVKLKFENNPDLDQKSRYLDPKYNRGYYQI